MYCIHKIILFLNGISSLTLIREIVTQQWWNMKERKERKKAKIISITLKCVNINISHNKQKVKV